MGDGAEVGVDVGARSVEEEVFRLRPGRARGVVLVGRALVVLVKEEREEEEDVRWTLLSCTT